MEIQTNMRLAIDQVLVIITQTPTQTHIHIFYILGFRSTGCARSSNWMCDL